MGEIHFHRYRGNAPAWQTLELSGGLQRYARRAKHSPRLICVLTVDLTMGVTAQDNERGIDSRGAQTSDRCVE